MDQLDRYVEARAASNHRFGACLAAGEATAEIGNHIRAARERLKLSLVDVASASGWSLERIEDLEVGRPIDFHLDELFILAQSLGLTVRICMEPFIKAL